MDVSPGVLVCVARDPKIGPLAARFDEVLTARIALLAQMFGTVLAVSENSKGQIWRQHLRTAQTESIPVPQRPGYPGWP